MNIAIIGAGTVGSGVIEILENNQELIKKRTTKKLTIKKVFVRDIEKYTKKGIKKELLTDNIDDIYANNIDIVIELIGGYDPAKDYILRALKNKKHVVTANKAVIAKHGKELIKAAKENNVKILFEAAVAGSIPIIKTIKESYASDKVKSIYGILNGTTNYILTKMEEGQSYSEALKKAQELGFAEADPTFDVEGLDAAQKIVILSRLAYNSDVNENISVKGITKLTKQDISYAKDLGYAVKLLAVSKLINNNLDIRVEPVMIPNTHALASVSNELNAVYLSAENSNESMLYGRGAGKLPTATAILSDIIEISKELIQNYDSSNKIELVDDIESRFYIRLMLVDVPGVVAKFAKVFGNNNISLHAINQKEQTSEVVPVTIITHSAKKSDVINSLQELKELDVVKEDPVYLLIEDFN